jgi:hypothetical protein
VFITVRPFSEESGGHLKRGERVQRQVSHIVSCKIIIIIVIINILKAAVMINRPSR